MGLLHEDVVDVGFGADAAVGEHRPEFLRELTKVPAAAAGVGEREERPGGAPESQGRRREPRAGPAPRRRRKSARSRMVGSALSATETADGWRPGAPWAW